MERRIVKVEEVPSLSWSVDKLYELGRRYGVEFPSDIDEENISMGKNELLELLWSQCEFETFQDPVEEVKGQRSSAMPTTESGQAYTYKATVRYIGASPLINLRFDNKNFMFLNSEKYSLDSSKYHIALQLSKRKDFDVSFDQAEPEDSLTSTMRRLQNDINESLYSDDEQEDFF